jgi:hypothetical protein
VVITHGGPGTISDAQRSGHRPIVFPRDPSRGEHVDDHQQRFAAWCAERDLVDLAREVDDLERLLAEVADTRAATADTARSRASVATFAELVGRGHVIGARPASAPPLLLVLDDGPLPPGADLGRLPPPDLGWAVLARRRLRRSERVDVLDYGRGVRERVAERLREGAEILAVAGADLPAALALAHDRQVAVAVLDRGLGVAARLALRHAQVPVVSPPARP